MRSQDYGFALSALRPLFLFRLQEFAGSTDTIVAGLLREYHPFFCIFRDTVTLDEKLGEGRAPHLVSSLTGSFEKLRSHFRVFFCPIAVLMH